LKLEKKKNSKRTSRIEWTEIKHREWSRIIEANK
jgi:hypothetical protein